MNALGEAIGTLCKIILPISEESYRGNPKASLAVCTLSSINLLKNFQNSEILSQISIAGRLLSENKGIDSIIRYLSEHQNITTLIICGKEVWGHKAGHSLLKLHKNGIDENKKIIGSTSPDPYLTVSEIQIKHFQQNVDIVNLTNETNFEQIIKKIKIN